MQSIYLKERIIKMKQEYKEKITNHIIASLEQGNIPWISPFEKQIIPMNYLTKRTYQGINLLLLWVSAMQSGFTGNYWVGFRQACTLGGRVKKGEKGVPIIVCCPSKIKSDNDEEILTHYYKTDYVFNLYSQVEGIDFDTATQCYASIEELDTLIDNIGANIRHQGERAYYDFGKDFINMPFHSKFKTKESYYQTLAHELIHYTMKENRCNRKLDCDSDSDNSRALEELTAEIGSAFLLAEFGIKADLQNTTAYVQSWIKALKDDVNFIFKASRHASEAVIYLLSFQQEKNVA